MHQWCCEHTEPEDRILIIDDFVSDEMKKYFREDEIVETYHKDGLTFRKALEAVKKLNRK